MVFGNGNAWSLPLNNITPQGIHNLRLDYHNEWNSTYSIALPTQMETESFRVTSSQYQYWSRTIGRRTYGTFFYPHCSFVHIIGLPALSDAIASTKMQN